MKKYLLLIIFVSSHVFGQEQDLGIVVEYSRLQEVTYTTYSSPLRINQVSKQSMIDYSKIEGLVQSYYSASDKNWAMSEYLDKKQTTARDEEHFEAVKSTDRENNYIQIETIYEFTLGTKKMAYVKYAFIMDKIPFPIIGILSAQKVNNRWYISNLLNQYEVNTIFTNFDTNILTQLFLGKSDNSFISDLAHKTKNKKGFFDFYKMIRIYNNWIKIGSKDSEKVMDKRLLIEGYETEKASINSKPFKKKYKVSHPFILDKAVFYKYSNQDKSLIKDEKTMKKYENQPEQLLLGEAPIDLKHKFNFTREGKEYFILKYYEGKLKVAVVEKIKSSYALVNKFNSWADLFLRIKSNIFVDLLQDSISDQRLNEVIKSCRGTTGGVNIDVLAKYFDDHKASLSKYLDE